MTEFPEGPHMGTLARRAVAAWHHKNLATSLEQIPASSELAISELCRKLDRWMQMLPRSAMLNDICAIRLLLRRAQATCELAHWHPVLEPKRSESSVHHTNHRNSSETATNAEAASSQGASWPAGTVFSKWQLHYASRNSGGFRQKHLISYSATGHRYCGHLSFPR